MRLWRTVTDVRGLDTTSADRLRVLLVADVWRRVHEDLLGEQVLAAVLDSGRAVDRSEEDAFRLRPPIGQAWAEEDVAEMLAGSPDVAFTSASRTPSMPDHEVFRVQPTSIASEEPEPLVLRLALLRCAYWTPAPLSIARLHRAEETLQRWRRKVADWADMPSCAPPAQQLEPLIRALTDRLATPAALTGLHRLEVDPQLSSGAKFEAFVRLDHVLALDLSHLVGKLPR